MKYEKPYLEEIELELEGSFLDSNSIPGNKSDQEYDGGEDEWD